MFTDDLGTADRLLGMAGGVLLLFVGAALLSSRVVRPLAAVTSPIGRWAAFALTALAWPFWLLPMWLLRLAAWGPGPTAKRWYAGIGGVLLCVVGAALLFALNESLVVLSLANLALPIVVLAMWIRSKVTSWRPEWPLEFPTVIPDRIAAQTGGENARRNPQRTAATAAALMIGVALVSFIAVLAEGLKTSNREAIEEQVSADYVVTSGDGYTYYPAGIGDALAASDVPEVVTAVRADVAEINGEDTEIAGIDPDTIASAYTFDWTEGSDAVLTELGTSGAIVSSNYADDHGISVGTRLRILSTSNETADVRVVGLYKPHPFYPLLESVTVSIDRFDQLYDRPRNRWTWANVAGEPSPANRAPLERAIAGYPDAQLETREEWIDREDEDIGEFLTFLYVLLALSVLISIFGMINTLVLSVYERTREIGMLRAIGMTRRQTRRMIRQESIITALIGAALGLPLGIFLAALVTRALTEFDLTFSIPWFQLVFLTLVAIVVGIVAAITPARRAAKLNPLEAIAYE
jgi:ABC-type antimicrobial peptide transport system permease subunit